MKKIIFILMLSLMINVWFLPLAVSAVTCTCTNYLTGTTETKECDVICSACGTNCVESFIADYGKDTNSGSKPVGGGDSAGVKLDNPIGGDGSLETLVARLIKYVIGISGIAALIAFVYGGVMWLISLGDANKIAKGKNIMVWALLGTVILFSAYAIVNMIFGALGFK